MSISMNEIQERRRSLQRAPPPKAPRVLPQSATMPKKKSAEDTNGVPDFAQLIPGFQLKKTGMRDSLIAADVDNKHMNNKNEEPENELLKAIRQRKEKIEEVEEETKPDKPKLKPKPRIQPRPTLKQRSSSTSSEGSVKENTGTIPVGEIIRKSHENKDSVNGDPHREPKLRNLPTLESLGKPPVKPVKPEHLVKLLGNYSRGEIVIARRRTTLNRSIANSTVISESNSTFEQEDYDDITEIKEEIQGRNKENGLELETRDNPFPANGDKAKQPNEEEGIFEENYDDVDTIAEQVKEINKGFEGGEENYDDVDAIAEQVKEMNESFEGPEETYDDLDTVGEKVQAQMRNDFKTDSSEKFGDELYDAVGSKKEDDNGFDSPVENKFSSSATPLSAQGKEKGKKDLTKKELEQRRKRERDEQKKKREEEKRRDKEEKEEKKRREEEKRKRERDDKDLRKKHKLKPGVEGSGVGEAKSNFPGDGKHELPAKQGETLTVVCEDGCPSGKWLVKNKDGHLGYVPKELITLKINSQGNNSEFITEDVYEEVDQYQNSGQKEDAHEPEVYDDLAEGEAIDEDLYEELPAD